VSNNALKRVVNSDFKRNGDGSKKAARIGERISRIDRLVKLEERVKAMEDRLQKKP